MHRDPEAQRERWLWGVTFILASLPLLGWWLYGLFDLDEGFYGSVSREMLRTGDWITPHLNGKPWFEKPILLYWLSAPSIGLFGENVGPRFPSILASLGLYALVGAFVARRLSPAVGRWAVVILATSPLVAALGRMMMTDMIFVLFLTWSFLALYRSFADGWKWRVLSGFALGMAVLAKGPVAIVLMVGLLGVTAWRQPSLRRAVFDWSANLAGLAALLVAVSIWYLPAYLASGQEFVQKFLIEQNVGRFTGGDEAHRVPLYLHPIYYPVILGLGMAPWSWRILEGWPKRIEIGEAGSTFFQFCAHWALVVLVFFTLSGTKLPHYILPAAVPLAILCARTVQAPLFGLGTMVWGIALALGLNFGFVWWYGKSGQEEAHRIARWLRQEGGPVVAYQLPRRQLDRGTYRPKLQETSLPSLGFYLDAPVVQAERLTDLLATQKPTWVFTRTGRLGPLDQVFLGKNGHRLVKARAPFLTENFEVFEDGRR